jgi:hypothetical protein
MFEVLELKKLGIELDMPASKLKGGCGEGVCEVISKLCNASLQSKFKFKKPAIKEENTGGVDDEGDDNADDMDGGGDIADIANQDISEDDIDGGDFGG